MITQNELLQNTIDGAVLLPDYLRKLIEEKVEQGVERGIARYHEEQRVNNSQLVSFVGVEISTNNATPQSCSSSLTTTPSSQDSVHSVLSTNSAKVYKINETLRRNKSKINKWKNKTLSDVFPVLNDESRLLMGILASEADFLTDLRYK